MANLHNCSATPHVDVAIMGTGAAGLGLALSLPSTTRIVLITKSELSAGSSSRAQGGIAAVMSRDEASLSAHITDTMIAGAGLCDPDVVEMVVRSARSAIEWLVEQGVEFTTESGQLHLTREGGHTERRVLHRDDSTGFEVVRTLAEQVLDRKNITLLTHHAAIDFDTKHKYNSELVGSVKVLDVESGEVKRLSARCFVIATGGASSCYLHTTNPDRTTGDGIAMAYRAGCRVEHMEFNQFHPTALYHPDAKYFLISEAVRGEGAVLRLPTGEAFMAKRHPMADLAPRDIVALSIETVMRENNLSHVYLDATGMPADFLKAHFPTIYEKCLSLGLDMAVDQLPVVPAAHYTCGGVVTDMDGRTDLKNLYVVGEAACTGLHGANRMASNSLLECVVFARRAAESIMRDLLAASDDCSASEPTPTAIESEMPLDDAQIQALLLQIRTCLSDVAGIARDAAQLQRGLSAVRAWKAVVDALVDKAPMSGGLLELRNTAEIAVLILEHACARKQSVGLHVVEAGANATP